MFLQPSHGFSAILAGAMNATGKIRFLNTRPIGPAAFELDERAPLLTPIT
jgi:hypothetical protein